MDIKMIDSDDEELFLADIEDSSDIFLADVQEDDNSETSANFSVNENSNSQARGENQENDFSELEQVYAVLKIESKPDNVDFKEYFKSNPEIFKIAGTDYYKSLSTEQYEAFEKKCTRLSEAANKKWRSSATNAKIAKLDEALGALKSIFRNVGATEAYSKEIKRNLTVQLNSFLLQKIKDNILDVSEIFEALDFAISIHLISDTEAERTGLLEAIKAAVEKHDVKIESFEETFTRLVKEKPKIERIDTTTIKNNLFAEYKSLAKIDSHVSGRTLQRDEDLRENMCRLLSDNGLLVPNDELFMREFLEPEIQKKGEFYFSVPINNDYFYYLKGTAVNKYELTEDQWRQITMIRNIRNESDFTVAFIMGYQKESSVSGITRLLEKNPAIAADRILAGDLETYFTHIGRYNISSEILQLKNAYSANKDELVTGVVTLLKGEMGDTIFVSEQEVPVKKVTLGNLIEKEAEMKELVSFIVKNKSDESLIEEIVRNDKTQERLQRLFAGKAKKYSYLKFLMNILNELLSEPDITQYKHSFFKISLKIQQKLVEHDDCITFLKVYARIVEIAVAKNIIVNENEISNYNENYEAMKNKFEMERKQDNSKNKKKFRLFGKAD